MQALDGIGMSLNFLPGTNIPVVVDLTPGKVAERCGKIRTGEFQVSMLASFKGQG